MMIIPDQKQSTRLWYEKTTLCKICYKQQGARLQNQIRDGARPAVPSFYTVTHNRGVIVGKLRASATWAMMSLLQVILLHRWMYAEYMSDNLHLLSKLNTTVQFNMEPPTSASFTEEQKTNGATI